MNINLWLAVVYFFASGYSFYRIIAKKEKKKHIATAGVATGAFLVLGVVYITPFVSKLIAKWFFTS
ncbi:MAG: hypothetical protein KAR79_05575 [Simkaniaceae bacterium]|nr:hypothetical protein [Simkaniaceae bacterium]